MNAKEYLSQIEKIDTMIENKSIELQRWRGIAESTVGHITGDRVQTSANHHRMEDAIVNMIDMEPETKSCIADLKKRRKAIIRDIESLKADECNVLYKVYVLRMTLQEVAAACAGKSYSWATTTHGRALQSIQRIIDERGDYIPGTKKSKGAE